MLVAVTTFVLCWFVPFVEMHPHGEHFSAWTVLTKFRWEDLDGWRCAGFVLFYTALFAVVSSIIGWATSRVIRTET